MRGSFRTDCCRWLIAVGLLISSYGVWGQENLISIECNDVEIREVLNHIEEQTGLVFSYNNRLFDDKERVSMNVEAVPLDAVLRIMFREMQIQHIIMEQQIILKRERKALFGDRSTEESGSVPGVRFTVSGYVKDAATGEILIGATVALPDQ
ncbi:MAG: STN domain-containing protein, partial [Bacteroidales bacterium]|nr:STN domain-containing protein [Bacteroidales bacterium]